MNDIPRHSPENQPTTNGYANREILAAAVRTPDSVPADGQNATQNGQRRTRVLVCGDSGTSASGFASVLRHIVRGLAATGLYEIDQIGVNFTGDYYDREEYPCRLYPALAAPWPGSGTGRRPGAG